MTLTKETIEGWREWVLRRLYPNRNDTEPKELGQQFNALCDLALVGLAVQPRPIASVSVMQTTAGPDYFVQFDCGNRSATVHKFKQRYKAEYEVAYFNWIFHGGDEPSLMDYNEDSWPGKPTTTKEPTP